MMLSYLFLLAAVWIVVLGWKSRHSGPTTSGVEHPAPAASSVAAPAAASPSPQAQPRHMIQLTLTEHEARIVRALLGLGAATLWRRDVEPGLTESCRRDLESLTLYLRPGEIAGAAGFYLAQLTSWLDARRPAEPVSSSRHSAPL